jgi:hypothetical protein
MARHGLDVGYDSPRDALGGAMGRSPGATTPRASLRDGRVCDWNFNRKIAVVHEDRRLGRMLKRRLISAHVRWITRNEWEE